MADEEKNPKPVAKPEAKVESKPEPESRPKAEGSISQSDATMIAKVAAEVANQMALNSNKPAARTPHADRTVRGGRYVDPDGRVTNAWGEPYEEDRDGTLSNPERPRY